MNAAQERRETELCGISLLGQHYSSSCQNPGRVRREVLFFIDLRWRLADDERQWCAGLLSENDGDARDGGDLVRQMYGVLAPDDFAGLAQCLGWFDAGDGAMHALLRDLPAGAESPAPHWELFPEPVLTAFGVLGSDPTLDLDAVNQIYKQKMKVLHPDARVGVDLDERESAEADAVVRRLSDARETIRAHFEALRRASSERTSRPPPSADPAKNDRIWNLTARARELVQQVQQTIEAAREIIKEAEQRIESARSKRQADIAAISNLATQPRQEIESLLGGARAHLASQGAESSAVYRPDYSAQAARSSGMDLRDARAVIANLRSLVNEQVIKTAKPKQTWRPDSDGSGCLMVILGIAAGAVGANLAGNFLGFVAGFAAVYGAVMLWLHHDPVSRLRSVSPEVEENAHNALGIIDQYTREMTRRTDAELQAAEQRFRAEVAQLDRSLQGQAAELQREIVSLWTDAKFSCAEWNVADWDRWRPASTPAFAARFAKLTAETTDLGRHLTANLNFVVPALVPFPEGRCLLLRASGAAKDAAAQAIQAVLARLLATIPPAKQRFTFIDPIALGSNVAAFMLLADHEESLVTSRAWSEPHHIEQRLGDLTEHMETVIQKYLRTEFKTIHEYNEAAKEVAEPYRFVVVFDFPVNFTDTAARRLISIARNGARCRCAPAPSPCGRRSLPLCGRKGRLRRAGWERRRWGHRAAAQAIEVR